MCAAACLLVLAAHLHVSIASKTLHALIGNRHRALANPILSDRRRDPPEGHLVLIILTTTALKGAREPRPQRIRRLRLNRQINEHAPHERLVCQSRAERLTMRCVVRGKLCGLPHERRGADGAVQTSVHDHFDDRADAFPKRAEQHAPSVGIPCHKYERGRE